MNHQQQTPNHNPNDNLSFRRFRERRDKPVEISGGNKTVPSTAKAKAAAILAASRKSVNKPDAGGDTTSDKSKQG